MKLTQLQINPVYAAFKNLTYTGMNPAEIGKIMRMSKFKVFKLTIKNKLC